MNATLHAVDEDGIAAAPVLNDKPRFDMSMGYLEDCMQSDSLAVRISAVRAAYTKGQLDGINDVGRKLGFV